MIAGRSSCLMFRWGTPQVTAEAMVVYLFDQNDTRYIGDQPIEVDAEEVAENREALSLGSRD
jgi:hypothetical protein